MFLHRKAAFSRKQDLNTCRTLFKNMFSVVEPACDELDIAVKFFGLAYVRACVRLNVTSLCVGRL